MLKRLAMLLLAAALCIPAAHAALPEDEWIEVTLPGCGVRLKLPERCGVLTRMMPEDAPVFQEVGGTPQQLDEWMINQSCYLDAYDAKTGFEVFLKIMPSKGKDFALYNDLQIKAHATDLKRQYKTMGLHTESVEAWRTEDAAWLVMQSVAETGDGAIIEALTRRDDQMYAVQVTYAPGSEGTADFLRTLLESVTFAQAD